MELNFGLKMWSSNAELIGEAEILIVNRIFQYVELTPIPGTNITPFLKRNIPYIIHIPTERQGLNIADRSNMAFNLSLINFAIDWADQLQAQYLILHPGFGKIENALGFLEEIHDRRILIENMPRVGLNNEKMIGYSKDQIILLQKNGKFGFCFDLNHAIKASISQNIDYRIFIDDFMGLVPQMFHVSDGRMDYEKDEHLHLGEGDYDLKYLREVIRGNTQKNRYVTFEIPHNDHSLEKFTKNLENFLAI